MQEKLLVVFQSCLPLVAVLVIDLVKRATNDRERKAAVIYGCALTG